MNYKIDVTEEEILEAIDKVVKKTMTMDMTWNWHCGVAYYGIAKAWEVTGKGEYMDMVQKVVDEYIELGLPKLNVNACAMGHVLISLYEYTKDEKYWNIALEKMNYLRNDALRFGDNVFQHTVSDKNDFPGQAWADTLFMAGYFLLRMGRKLNDEEIIKDALNQYYWHIQYLQDEKSSLFFHGYNDMDKSHMSGVHWGRANAWAAYTMAEARYLVNYLYPEFMEIDCSLRDQLSALKRIQTENGLWRTVLDDGISYEEVSASAGIGAAMTLYGNPLFTKSINAALKGLLANIDEDGKVMNVSGGTAVMNTVEDYRNIPKKYIQGYGQGLALAFLAALLRKEVVHD